MSNLLKSKFFLGTLVVAVMFVGAFALSANKASADCSITSTLKVGSKGEQVKCLQGKVGAVADGSFGPNTKAKVMAWQTSAGLTADGVVGPMSRAALAGVMTGGTYPAGCTSATGFSTTTGLPCNSGGTLPAGCTSTAGYSPTTGAKCDGGAAAGGPLMGGAGNLDDVDVLSTYSSEDVSEGFKDVKIMSFDVDADNGSDLAITSVKLAFAHNSTDNGSDNMNKYISKVSIWNGSTMVGSATEAEFSESGTNNVYTKNIAISGATVKADGTVNLVVAIDAVGSIDTGDQNENWTVALQSLRYQDATGVVTTDSSTGDLVSNTLPDTGAANETNEVSFSFEELTTSGDLEIKLTEATASPDARSVQVDSVSDTNGVVLLGFDLKATGSRITVDELKFDVTPTGADANEIVKEFRLMKGNTVVDTISSPSIATTVTGQITFTDLEDEIDLADGSTTGFTLVADINDLEGAFTAGDYILASLTSTNFNSTNSVIEDSNGDSIQNSDRVGSVTGERQTFYEDGISLVLDSVDADSFTVEAVDNDRAELVIKFKATAFGADIYIPSFMTPTTASTNATVGTASTGTAPTTASGVAFHVQSADTGLLIAHLAGSTLTSTAQEMTNSFKIIEGQTETFTLKVIVTNVGASVLDSASVRALLSGVNFALTDVATGAFVYTSDLADTFKTPYATIAD